MGGCRFRYEDLPGRLRVRVDAAMAKPSGEPTAAGASPRATRQRPRDASGGCTRGRCPNKTEAAYRGEVLATRSDVVGVRYEALTFRMANGHRYTPDWVVVTDQGQIECHEVKGGRALHSQQRARLAFDQARVEFPWFVWVWATRTRCGWEVLR